MKSPQLPFKGAKIEYDNKNYAYENMVLHLEPEQKTSYIRGAVLAERLKEKGLSASVLDYLLENKDKIPEEWKEDSKGNTRLIFFLGTIFRNSDGDLYMRCLYFHDGEWQTDYDWLDNRFHDDDPAVVSESSLVSDTELSLDTLSLEKAIEICKKNGLKITREKLVIEEL